MHAGRHPRRVTIPDGEIRGQVLFAQKVLPNSTRINQVFGPDYREDSRHLRAVQIALQPHQILRESHLALIEKQKEFARLGKVDLGCE